MTTWHDKPNDYDHALIMLADLREANEKLVASVMVVRDLVNEALAAAPGRIHVNDEDRAN